MSKLAEITARFEAADAADAAALADPQQTTDAEPAAAEDAVSAEPGAEPGTADAAAADPGTAAADTAAEPRIDDKPPAWWEKALQREQIERTNVARQIQALQESISQRGAATPAETKQLDAAAQNLQQSTARLTKIKGLLGKDFDAFEKGGEVLGDVTEVLGDQETRLSRLEAENQQLRQRQEARDAYDQQQAQAREFWPKFEAANPGVGGEKLWQEVVQELSQKGYSGERLNGAVEVLWQSKVDAAIAAKKSSNVTPPQTSAPKTAASARNPAITPGGAQIVATGAGARNPAVRKSAQQLIDDGDVDFFGGRYPPKS